MNAYTPPHATIGDGPRRVLALHGWFGDRHAYEPIWPYLDRSGFTYAFMDFRGYGEAKDQPGAYTMEEVAADTVALADHLGWDRFSLVGHSMGGKAVERVLVDAPERVHKLVGINPVPASQMPFDEQSWGLFSGAPDRPENRRAIIDFTTGNRLTGTWLDAMVRHSVECSTKEAFAAYLEAWAKSDFHDQVRDREVPVKLIVGENDPAIGADFVRDTWLRWHPRPSSRCSRTPATTRRTRPRSRWRPRWSAFSPRERLVRAPP
ncbi:MAG: alpha/beta fold hydrolase [Streptosporangiaceae bacterium]